MQHASAGPLSAEQVLRRAERAGAGGVRRRFRELSMRVHPDKCTLPGAQKVPSCCLTQLMPLPGASSAHELMFGAGWQRSISFAWAPSQWCQTLLQSRDCLMGLSRLFVCLDERWTDRKLHIAPACPC